MTSGVLLVPASLAALTHYQRRLTALTRDMRERGADLGSLLVDTVMGMRVVTALRALAASGFHVLAGVRRDADGDAIRGTGIEPPSGYW